MNEEKGILRSKCRFCGAELEHWFADVVFCQDYAKIVIAEPVVLPTYVCSHCFLVQTIEDLKPEQIEEVYLSSFSSSRLIELQKFTNSIFKRFEMTDSTLEAEFVGHENGRSIFGNRNLHALIDIYGKADLLVCHDALTYSLDINDFVSALKSFLKPEGTITLEFLHLLPWMEEATGVITSRPFPYLSFTIVEKILNYHGLVSYDVMKSSKKASLKIHVKHKENIRQAINARVTLLLNAELAKGLISALPIYTW